MVEALGEAIIPYLDKPFAFFGHSMGAMTGFELACWLRDRNYPQPVYLFASGQRAPQLPNNDPLTYNLPDADFIRELSNLNGTPREALAHPELMAIMLPLLRADFEVVETYAYKPQAPLNCPIIAFGGLQDDKVSRDQLEAWRHLTTGAFSVRGLPGDHFFLHSHQGLLLRALSHELSRVVVNLEPPRALVIH
jgi:medium-chain acyl-[acyl-carrier-protein] hydrolase